MGKMPINHLENFQLAAEVAAHAKCKRARCGSVVVTAAGEVIGKGYNAPPLDDGHREYVMLNGI